MMLTRSKTWRDLEAHRQALAEKSLRELFAEDPQRVAALSFSFEGLFYDFSKQRLTGQTLQLLRALAQERGVEEGIRRMFAGEHINNTEDRAALHVALRY